MWKNVLQSEGPDMTIKYSKEKIQFAWGGGTEAKIQAYSHNTQYVLPSYDKNVYANALQCYTYVVCLVTFFCMTFIVHLRFCRSLLKFQCKGKSVLSPCIFADN